METARAKVPILEVGNDGEDGYFAMIESEVVARFVARNWQERSTQLIPSHPNDEAKMNLFVEVFMEEVSGKCTSSPPPPQLDFQGYP